MSELWDKSWRSALPCMRDGDLSSDSKNRFVGPRYSLRESALVRTTGFVSDELVGKPFSVLPGPWEYLTCRGG